MIVRRPAVDEREVLDEARLDVTLGLTGDTWRERGSSSTPDGTANPAAQVTVMSARAAALIAGDRERWPLAGDQLFVDLDLGGENLPPGTRLSLGDAVLEVSAKPHTGCKKFAERFGQDAARFVNSPVGRELSLRGINTRVVVPGTVRVGDTVRKASD
jgi:MOSC domain-containing protein YiiM